MFSHFLRKLWPFARPAGARMARAGGLVWRALPDAEAVFGPCGPDLARWLADPDTQRVKHGPHRTVYRVVLPGGAVYVKHCRVSGPRAWAREVLRPAKARLEFENALALREKDIPAVCPLAWGSRHAAWPGESFLVTAARDTAVPFVQFLETVFPTLPPDEQPAVRRQLARALGEFLAKLHAAGVAHPDPHPGNLLVELPPSHAPRFFLIDLHAVRFGRPLTWAERRTNLVLYNRWFQLRASRTDRLRFWHSYRQGLKDADAQRVREVEAGTTASNRRFWAGRESRCLGTNRYFRRVKSAAVHGFAVTDLPDATVRQIAADPDAVFKRPGVIPLKDSRTSTVAEFVTETADGPRAVILKRFRVRGWWEPLKGLFRRTPALRSWVAGHSLRDRWLPTPRPLLVLHRRRFGLTAEGYLLVEKVPDAVGLAEAVAGSADRRALADELAGVLRRMHDHAVSHRDLKAANVLLSAGRPVFIDLVGVRTGRVPSVGQRAKELARLNASFLASPRATRTERLRFLLAYLRAGLGQGRDWKDWWARVGCATAAKVAKNRRTGRPLA